MHGLTQEEEEIMRECLACESGPPNAGKCVGCVPFPVTIDQALFAVSLRMCTRGLLVHYECEIQPKNLHVHVTPTGRLVFALVAMARAA